MKKLSRAITYNYYLVLIIAFFKFGKINKEKNFAVVKMGKKGEGLVSKNIIRKGQLAFVATGRVRHAIFKGDDCYLYPDWYMVDDGTWIDITYPYVKTNHSCDPNLGILMGRCFVALRDISAGEELTFDYSLTDDEEIWYMAKGRCLCDSSDCRETIGAIQTLPIAYYNKSYPYISKYFVDLYNNIKMSKM